MQLAPSDADQGTAGNDRDPQIRDLQATIVAMREALELKDQEARERLQAALAEASAETEQLKAMIRTLREELEAQHQAHQAALQQQRQEAAAEIRQLQATIRAMREGLEGKGR